MDKVFSSELRYRLVFDNVKGFSIGFNMILVPASVSTLGKAEPDGVNLKVTKDSETKLYKRSVVNNAAYDYYERCSPGDLNLLPPPGGLRIWLFHKLQSSSTMMLHHGAVLDMEIVSSFLGDFAPLVKIFVPDITIGVKGKDDFASIYSEVCHELAHASHFRKVGTDYWNNYLMYVLGSYITTGGMTYGDGTGTNAGHCEVGEMWAYYLQSKLFKERYGGNFPSFGTGWWFYPQIFRFLDERGLGQSDIFSVLETNVDSKDALKQALMLKYPEKQDMIGQVFSRY